MSAQLQQFDPISYKQTTLQQWNNAAEAWDRWGSLLSQWLGKATDVMLDMARVGPGSRVLDVAAGAGEQTSALRAVWGKKGRYWPPTFLPRSWSMPERLPATQGWTMYAPA